MYQQSHLLFGVHAGDSTSCSGMISFLNIFGVIVGKVALLVPIADPEQFLIWPVNHSTVYLYMCTPLWVRVINEICHSTVYLYMCIPLWVRVIK